MTQAIDWEAQIEDIRNKATAAARHSERTVNGVAQTISEMTAQSRSLAKLSQEHQETNRRLGSLEDAIQHQLARSARHPSQEGRGLSMPFLCSLFGFLIGAVASGVFLWS
jgi:hypothetical protein